MFCPSLTSLARLCQQPEDCPPGIRPAWQGYVPTKLCPAGAGGGEPIECCSYSGAPSGHFPGSTAQPKWGEGGLTFGCPHSPLPWSLQVCTLHPRNGWPRERLG